MKPRDEFVELRGLRFHYCDWGGRGRPVVLLHGLASNCRIWDLMAPYLAEDFRVLALDQRGHGLSDKPDDGYDFASITSDLEEFVQALGLQRPALVGHSWGGSVVLQYAAERPEAVAWVALVDGGFLEISALPEMTWERTLATMSPPPLAGMKLNDFLQAARTWSGLGEMWSEEVQEIVLANFSIDGEGAIYPHLKRENHLKILRALWEQKASGMWSRLRCPALLLPAGGHPADRRAGIWMEQKRKGVAEAEKRAPSARVVWIENAIHDVPLQKPKELADAIARFAAEVA